jgi:hypothetical protein
MPSAVFRPTAENWCISKCDTEKVYFEWNIQKFLLVTAEGQDGKSVEFQEKKHPSRMWCLSFDNSEGDVIFSVSQPFRHYTDQSYRVEIGILNNEEGQTICNREVFVPKKTDWNYEVYNISKELVRTRNILLKDGSLTVSCEIEYITKEESVSNIDITTTCAQPFNCNDEIATSTLERLFEDGQLSDVILSVHGRQFQAHKCILSSSSKVFEAEFKYNVSNQVVIEDIQPGVFHQLLRFIYTGRLTSATMETMAARLFAAADKYLLNQLKSECESHLRHQMSAENCMELLLLIIDQIHPADNLKQSAVDFFRRYPREVMATDGWKKTRQEHPNHSIWNML